MRYEEVVICTEDRSFLELDCVLAAEQVFQLT
jgi:hypothetical protein